MVKVGCVSFEPELTRQVLPSQDVSTRNLWANLTDRDLIWSDHGGVRQLVIGVVSSLRFVADLIRES